MKDLNDPILIMGVTLLVVVAFYLIVNRSGGKEEQNEEGDKLPTTIYDNEYIEKPKPKNMVEVSFSVWQSFKFGFGLGLGLMLATAFFWIVLSSFIITTLKSFMSPLVF